MRLRRLDLIRYGHFTDRSFELPGGEADLHIIFGPNEAGKSTALAAIEDLLFGIPARSPYGFLHDYKNMRVGAVLDKDGAKLEFRRRKGTKETLLDIEDLALPGGEGALRPFLESADRAFFERMFSLDHVRLEQGGRDILSASDEVGQMLFSAGAGIGGLRDRLTKLTEEANGLWGARRAKGRLYTQAEDRLKEADKLLREQTLTAKEWNALRRAYETAEEQYQAIEEEFQKRSTEARRLSRIRRVYLFVSRKRELETEIAQLGEHVALPDDAAQLLEQAEREASIASGSIKTVTGQLVRAREELEGLTYDEALVARAADVGALNERRIVIQGEKADLPKRQAELDAAEKEFFALAGELGWREGSVDEFVERIPPRSDVKVAGSLLGERGELALAVAGGTKELEEAEAAMVKLRERLDRLGESPDVSKLAAVVQAVRGAGDVAERARAAEQKVRDNALHIQALLSSLNPAAAGESAVVEMKVPSVADVQSHRDKVRDWEQRMRSAQQEVEQSEERLTAARGAFKRTERDERAITAEEIGDARSQRDELWGLVRLKHVEGSTIPEALRIKHANDLDSLPSRFEETLMNADVIADERFDTAEASGRLTEMSRSLELQEEQLRNLQAKVNRLDREGEALDAEWQSMWADAGIEPLTPDAMLEWLAVRSNVQDAIEDRIQRSGDSENLNAQVRDAKESLSVEMAALGVERSSVERSPLPVILEQAADLQKRYEGEIQEEARLRSDFADAETEVERREREAQRAGESWSAWETQWSTAVENLGLAAELMPAEIEAQIDIIGQIREKVARINNLRHERIAKINRDIAGFDDVTHELVRTVAADLAGWTAGEAALELQQRLVAAERARDLREAKQGEVTSHEEQIAKLEQARQGARQSLLHLHEAAGTESTDALRLAIEKSNAVRDCEHELQTTLDTLRNEGDGLSVVQLEDECAAVDVDQIAAIESTNSQELVELGPRRTQAVEERSQARAAFQSIGGDDAAAQAAGARQEALAEMGDAAVRYARVRASATLLQWAIDRFRREKQAPLLKRAGELFATVTGGSFSELRVDYEDDQPELLGLRPDGEKVGVSGMSSGTRDQLYLALRVASIEDYLGRAAKLPFVADDLFVNFDDGRAAAGFEVLGHLAKKTQVLFFTHHQHLVDVARSALGGAVHVVSL